MDWDQLRDPQSCNCVCDGGHGTPFRREDHGLNTGFEIKGKCVATFGVTMKIEWDEAKNRANIRKHGFDFADAEEVFRGILTRGEMRVLVL
jgi:hypothetical protein